MLEARGVSGGEIAQLHRTRRWSLFAVQVGSPGGGEEEGASHLMFDIVQRVGTVHRETYQDDVCLGIRQGAQPFVVLLSCCIP